MDNTTRKVPGSHYQKSVNWQALAYFNFYRVLLSGLFILLIYIGQLPQPLGVLNEKLFSLVSQVYLILAIIFSFFVNKRYPRYNLQIALHVLVDIGALTLLMYSSNGLSSGFGMLIIIAVAGGSILREGRISILFAAIATFAVLSHELYIQFFRYIDTFNYTHAGILGATFFITAIIGNMLSARVRQTEALAKQQAIEINELAKLNEHIVQRMQAGIIVLDSDRNILLINESAKSLLGDDGENTNKIFHFISNHIKSYIDGWLNNNGKQNVIIKLRDGEVELQASFIKLNLVSNYQILVFLEDIGRLRQHAQQLKLASLGRLTASIAHEVRNPLGAINHAGQLLHESETLTDEDQRLTEIINDHSLRINNIIENVLSVSRRGQTTPEKFDIVTWMKKFIGEFDARFSLTEKSVILDVNKKNIFVRMDPSQLYQVIWNLCENAIRYSRGKPMITLVCDISDETQRPYIDIIDYGEGMSDAVKAQLFEPFFTTEVKGSGLGLYLARELCEANQASLSLYSTSTDGTTFRLSFMHLNKQNDLI
ncbi:MAG: two-component system sensor histidine kinase PilS (NtrC family) [Gammaproteobacteria bacterium]|jgi:two-component system sensor histidine kinase PilS (NtrC family)